ncbi:hypothetical protein [Pseudobacteriovorax antillogorgiicola]|uniref:Uncharacterized protein n=1 Tax=Pseudobacteriovorax antillogorgiicola TaxID=1513793 RepID=A0A1Y6CN01_9BACT|nr:hypothetical protein [Pseudobacteriovorax antillogorgiicola]TCS44804.1 hypothetical protein EDD56_13133 [Pseudobacteriovorax antillogorgiicola]SMF77334.1 hypothetical protein SAMN06296036_13131 [Pseudobacteriovorax antillogorgiicola]
MKIGLRTITILTLLAALLGLGWALDLFKLSYIERLQPLTLTVIGGLTLLFTDICGRLLGQRRASDFGFSILKRGQELPGKVVLLNIFRLEFSLFENRGRPALELPLWLQKALLLPAFFLITMLVVNSRTLILMADAPRYFEESNNQYCPDEDDEAEAEEQVPPGCELVIRAYKLGYSDSLGDCETKKDQQEGEDGICYKRQKDEPFLHFTYRQLETVYQNFDLWLNENSVSDQVKDFKEKTANLDKLVKAQQHSMEASPHSVHHIFTNLAKPPQSLEQRFRELTESNYCLQKYSDLPHTIRLEHGWDTYNSQNFEFSYAHLLFNDRHQPAAGFCREFAIHWAADTDSCDRLSANPEEFLKDHGIWSDVNDVLQRQDSLAYLGGYDERPREHLLSRVVSFQCLNFNELAQEVESRTYTISGQDVASATVTLVQEDQVKPHKLPRKVMKGLAKTLIPHFSYSTYLSNQELASSSEEDFAARFEEVSPMLLTQLEYLRKADIMLGHDWLQEQPDLLEVYPWHLHLYNFVDSFRKEYRNSRGRL